MRHSTISMKKRRIMSVRGSVSLPEQDWEYLDCYAAEQNLDSRSAAVHEAVVSLRERRLALDYAAAWEEWEQSGEAEIWSATAGDGLSNS